MTKDNVVSIRNQPMPTSNPPPITDDPIFFHKSNVRVGSVFVYYGRTAPRTEWRVREITSWFRTGTKKTPFVAKSINYVRQLKDELHMERIGGEHDTKTITFGYSSYSAIWRLK